MPLPKSNYIETPVLQELIAVGGADEVRFLYERLVAYFPQIETADVQTNEGETNKNWRKAVQAAGKILDEKGFLHRQNGFWTITAKGREAIAAESLEIDFNTQTEEPLSHTAIQQMLIEIAECLNFYAVAEFEYFDVVWRESSRSPRLSHVFEVQSKGNIDSAFAKLKRAYQSQRTKPFLVVQSERDLNRARQSLAREFADIEQALTILTFVEIKKVHRNLTAVGEILPALLAV